MRRPDFIIGGATRSGLRILSEILGRHPQIFIPERAEYKFFRRYGLANIPRSCHRAFEDAVNPHYRVRIPESRILYGEEEFDALRAYKSCSGSRVIFTLRNPVERCYQQFLHGRVAKKEPFKSFEKAIEAELSGQRVQGKSSLCWVHKNRYKTHLDPWLTLYPKDRVLVLIYEEWEGEDRFNFKALERFLGLKPDSLFSENVLTMLSEPKPKKIVMPMSGNMRERLEDLFEEDKSFIESLVGRKIQAWARR